MARHITEKDNFAYLTIGLVLLLFVSALVDNFHITLGGHVIEAAVTMTLIIGVWSIRTERRWFRTGFGLIAAIVVIFLAGLFLDLAGLYMIHLVLLLCFLVLSVWVAAKQALFAGRVEANTIIGAVCIYLLLGIIWAVLYVFVNLALPGSFHGVSATDPRDCFHALLYFSFVSLTTQGFGDISPALPLAQFLTYTEGIVGQLYMAIVVASLVGIRISSRQQ